jgi:hypothetical protein
VDDRGRGYRVWWDDEAHIARADWIDGAAVDREAAMACEAEVEKLGDAQQMLYLVDIRDMGSIDRRAREYFTEHGSYYRAVALVAGSAATRMMANFFLRLNRGDLPVRMFTDEAEAIAWLQAQR